MNKKYDILVQSLFISIILIFIGGFHIIALKTHNIEDVYLFLIIELLFSIAIYNYYVLYNAKKGVLVYSKANEIGAMHLKRYFTISLCVGLTIDVLLWLPSFLSDIKLQGLGYKGYFYWFMIFFISLIIFFIIIFIPLCIAFVKVKKLKHPKQ